MKQTDIAASHNLIRIINDKIKDSLPSIVLPVKSTFPVLKSNSFTVLSSHAVAKMSPFGFHRTQLIGSVRNKLLFLFSPKDLTQMNVMESSYNLRFAFIKNLDIALIATGYKQIPIALTNINPVCIACRSEKY